MEPFIDPPAIVREAVKGARTRTHYIIQARRVGDEAEEARHRDHKNYYLRLAREFYDRPEMDEEAT